MPSRWVTVTQISLAAAPRSARFPVEPCMNSVSPMRP
jgi:hypothetical protein